MQEQTPLLASTTSFSQPIRLAALDLVRGVLMVFMAIDHAKEFLSNFAYPHEQWYEMPNYKGNSLHFLSRFVTSFCAPGFFMLMGWGVALFIESRRKSGWSWIDIFKHFALRGLVLIMLNDIMMIPFRSEMHLTHYVFATSVLFALGVNIFLASVFAYFEESVGLTSVVYFVFPAILTILPSLWIPLPEDASKNFDFWYLFWFLPKASPSSPYPMLSVYPPIPWLAHTLWGVGIGRASKLLKWDSQQLGLFNFLCGISMISVAIPLRYGVSWTSINPQLVVPPVQASFISFFNNVKYPPSVVYTLITVGVNQLLLGLLFFANPTVNTDKGVLMVFGGCSLFFYVSHFAVYWTMGTVLGGLGLMPKERYGDGVFWF
ncbi:hypothetical protein BDR26DRAFT_660849 [Obelidium mucronatum]|nr:hypothetical protein BDR26DRAFT_660849 [Obelidium mucronatum]